MPARDPHESFWTYKAATPTPEAPAGYDPAEWESLSPGMRREIARDAARRAATSQKGTN